MKYVVITTIVISQEKDVTTSFHSFNTLMEAQEYVEHHFCYLDTYLDSLGFPTMKVWSDEYYNDCKIYVEENESWCMYKWEIKRF